MVAVGALLLASLWPAAATGASFDVRAATISDIERQANWILGAQLPDGAISVWPDRPHLRLIWPNLANEAAAGLARATEVTGDAVYARHAWAYLDWYAGAEQPGTGYVTDYKIVRGTTPESNGSIDSTDAYAGTFLSAAWDTYAATGDRADLRHLAPGIAGAIHAIESTQQPDGLTWAKPTWHVAYLMDNAQALGGLDAAAALENALGNPLLANEAAADAARLRAGIGQLWDPRTNAFDWAKQANGWQHTTVWSNFYPDAMEQVSAVMWGAVRGTRATRIMAEVVSHQPDWSEPTATGDYLNGATVQQQSIGYWPRVGTALATVGKAPSDIVGVARILSAASSAHWVWPYTTGNAGNAILALSGRPALDPTGS